jgi:uncharacterized protein (DUF1697 family)
MKWAAMLRGINLGKRQIVKADLLAAVASCGFTDARTLLASGNLVFDAGERERDVIERDLHAAVEARTGIASEVFARNGAEFDKLIHANPFPEAARDRPSQLLVLFHRAPVPEGELARIAEAYDGPERLKAAGRELFIDYPEGMGRSKLDPAMAKLKLKLPQGTGRNWNTVSRLAAMLAD